MYYCPLVFFFFWLIAAIFLCVYVRACEQIAQEAGRKSVESPNTPSWSQVSITNVLTWCWSAPPAKQTNRPCKIFKKPEQSLALHACRHKVTQMIKSSGKLALAVRLRFKGEQQAGRTCYSRYSKRAKLNFKRLPFVIHLLTARALSVKIKRGYQSARGGQQRYE